MQIPRQIRFFFQRLVRGWDDSDTWSLNTTIAEFIYPRLKRFKAIKNSTPVGMNFNEWDDIINKMLFAFGLEIYEFSDKKGNVAEEIGLDVEEYNKYDSYFHTCWEKKENGLELFKKYYLDLWW